MKRPRLNPGLRAAADSIAAGLGVQPPPEIRIGRGRITVKFKQAGASGWQESERIEHAMHVATVVRSSLAGHKRWSLRRRASRAVVVIYEDALIANGCDIDAKWECVVPAAADAMRR